ncbi:hypothetical protein R3W88_017862 [Solanum pinnatisectum]|uniref:Uncharacterized protein n=1 Tax=Solanum pinnatisectum TaxID=50273 RepID=A0AAV9L411_9SOLN|nr:hypothetical protein R3W88_017862 [Solanum pinnatisectum]
MIFVHWNPKSQLCSLFSDKEDIPIFDYCNSNSNCDGLFLIGIWTDRHVEQPAGLVIWNPSTHDDDDGDRGSTYGMAYDSTSDDYKIFRIDISGKQDNEILALKNGCWRIIDSKTSSRTDSSRLLMGREFLAFVDGAFHWIGFLSKVCVISFNISDEIGMLGVYYKDDNNYNLWEMQKYGIKDSWMKLFTIVIAVGSYYNIKPKYTFSDDRVLLCFDKMNWIISSDPMFPQQDYDKGDVMDDEGHVYTESLVFPKAIKLLNALLVK